MNKITVTCIIEEPGASPAILCNLEGPPMDIADLAPAYGLMIAAIGHNARMVADSLPAEFQKLFNDVLAKNMLKKLDKNFTGHVRINEVKP